MKQSCGYKWEYELRKKLEPYGLVFRVAGSGVGKTACADLIFLPRFGIFGNAYAIECKATHGDTYYAGRKEKERFRDMIEKCDGTWATPVLALKFLQIKGRKTKIFFHTLTTVDHLFPIRAKEVPHMTINDYFKRPDGKKIQDEKTI